MLNCSPCCLPNRARVRLASEVARGREGGDSCTEHRDAVSMDKSDHLFVRLDEVLIDSVLRVCRCGCSADIVDALKDHGVLHARMGENITVDATESVRAQTVCENAVAACCEVAKGDVLGGTALLKTGEEEIRPAVILIWGRATTVGNGVTHDQHAANGLGRPGFDAG